MGKFDPYSRRELRRLRAAYLRRNRAVVVKIVVLFALLLAFETTVALLVLSGPVRWYVLGVVHAGLVAAGLHLLHSAHLAFDRDAMNHIRGAWGEDNTRSELQAAKRRRLIWGWVDSINLQAGDLDHVVVTRHGGLVAIDTKWRNHITSNDTTDMARAAEKARRRAEGVARTLLKADRTGRHRARVQSLHVLPLVVVWGAAQQTVPDGAVVQGVPFVRGRDLSRWLRALEGDEVSKDAAAHALAELRKYRATTATSTGAVPRGR